MKYKKVNSIDFISSPDWSVFAHFLQKPKFLMHNYNVFLFLTVWLQFCTPNEPLPKVSSGRMERWENFKSEFVTPRNIDVWLPENYDGEKSFAVLYMHYGQMLYDTIVLLHGTNRLGM